MMKEKKGREREREREKFDAVTVPVLLQYRYMPHVCTGLSERGGGKGQVRGEGVEC